MTNRHEGCVSTMLTDKRLEYCTAGAPVQGSGRRKAGMQADKHGISGVFRLDNVRSRHVATRSDASLDTGGAPARAARATGCRSQDWQPFGRYVASCDAENPSSGRGASRSERGHFFTRAGSSHAGSSRGLEGEGGRRKLCAWPTNRASAITSPATKSLHFCAPRGRARATARATTP